MLFRVLSVARENIIRFADRGNITKILKWTEVRNSRCCSADFGACGRRPAARSEYPREEATEKKKRRHNGCVGKEEGIENRRVRFVTTFVRRAGASTSITTVRAPRTRRYISVPTRPWMATFVCRSKVWKIVVFFVRGRLRGRIPASKHSKL